MPKTPSTGDADVTTNDSASTTSGKGRPTPSRKESQSLRAQPLVGSANSPATKASKQQVNDARERARQGYAAGEDKYLPARDKGPQRRFVRDYVDARTSFGEWMLPLMLLIVILTFVPDPNIQLVSTLTIWAYVVVLAIDSVVLTFRMMKRITAKFGAGKVESGLRWYAIMRTLQLRQLRLPKPQVRRGQYPH